MTSRILALHPRLVALGLIASLTLSGRGGDDDAATSSPNAARTTLPGAVVRGRADTLMWLARARRGTDAARALAHADEAVAAMQPSPGGDKNHVRQWLFAQALGERALALQAAGRPDPARLAAQASIAAWQAMPDSVVPGAFVRWVQPVRALLGSQPIRSGAIPPGSGPRRQQVGATLAPLTLSCE